VVNNNAYAIYTSEKSIPNVLEKLDINYKNHPKEAIAQYVGESSPNMETLLFLKNHFWLFLELFCLHTNRVNAMEICTNHTFFS
jgi:hypothetical protein